LTLAADGHQAESAVPAAEGRQVVDMQPRPPVGGGEARRVEKAPLNVKFLPRRVDRGHFLETGDDRRDRFPDSPGVRHGLPVERLLGVAQNIRRERRDHLDPRCVDRRAGPGRRRSGERN
jgi:hypothetical protein